MEEQPTSTGAEQPAAPIPPTPRADAERIHIAAGDDMPLTHAEWTAFAALPPTERADVYIRALRSMTAVVATLAVAAPVAAVILAMPVIGCRGRGRGRGPGRGRGLGRGHDRRSATMAESSR